MVNTDMLCLCSEGFFQYAGTENAIECRCDNQYGKYGLDYGCGCTISCPGNDSETCGSGYGNDVYRIYSEYRSYCLKVT